MAKSSKTKANKKMVARIEREELDFAVIVT